MNQIKFDVRIVDYQLDINGKNFKWNNKLPLLARFRSLMIKQLSVASCKTAHGYLRYNSFEFKTIWDTTWLSKNGYAPTFLDIDSNSGDIDYDLRATSVTRNVTKNGGESWV